MTERISILARPCFHESESYVTYWMCLNVSRKKHPHRHTYFRGTGADEDGDKDTSTEDGEDGEKREDGEDGEDNEDGEGGDEQPRYICATKFTWDDAHLDRVRRKFGKLPARGWRFVEGSEIKDYYYDTKENCFIDKEIVDHDGDDDGDGDDGEGGNDSDGSEDGEDGSSSCRRARKTRRHCKRYRWEMAEKKVLLLDDVSEDEEEHETRQIMI